MRSNQSRKRRAVFQQYHQWLFHGDKALRESVNALKFRICIHFSWHNITFPRDSAHSLPLWLGILRVFAS